MHLPLNKPDAQRNHKPTCVRKGILKATTADIRAGGGQSLRETVTYSLCPPNHNEMLISANHLTQSLEHVRVSMKPH